ncbi:alpha/beta hydrolase family protein [Actinoplanes teichomyceticus]|uniref:Platelet-activating factor acetylhydrolase isoform II n=1 Tax=Actinoplanes teichomyceticus TaxID=1867 RepID=A0A561WB74_ACTTI|nr:acetylhydrolase [Actinoplanes teichomyceticus]TWG21114.1 platelet-activating factor acetylhydrolase isoform II [Actinoplanes teichomyceticus]GIF14935.1 lipase [Actinoplanes teichomyceticus]
MTLSRRRLLAATLAAGAAGSLTAACPASAAPGRARFTLPAPTGPYRVGTVSLHLIDTSRPDRVAGRARHHELMASIWYPATPDARRCPAAVWLPDAPMRGLLANSGFPVDVAASPLTAGREGATALRALGRRPVIVFSHGSYGHRGETTVIVQELASRGYVVVTVDTTYDAFTEFPDGRLGVPGDDLSTTPRDHAADIPFVLDRIEDLAAGRNPDAEHRRLPAGLAEILDMRRIGMFGFSKGGTATALAMIDDRRIRAGLSLDGPMQCQPPIAADIDRPFLMMTADFTRVGGSSAADFWTHLHGWRRDLQIDDGTELSCSDAVWLLPQMARLTGMTNQDLTGWIGMFRPSLAVKIQQTYPLAFFDLHLRHRRQPLFDSSRPPFPGVHLTA